MSNMRMWAVLLLCAACGGSGSGVDGGKRLTALSDSQIRDVCQFTVDVAGPKRTIDCGGGVTVDVGGQSLADCIAATTEAQTAFPNCTATVSDVEACVQAIADFTDAQQCMETPAPPACAPLATADCSGG